MASNPFYQKSKEYQSAVKVLQKHPNPTNNVEIHNSYYDCYLHLKYILSLFFVHPDIMDEFLKKFNKVENIGSHDALFHAFGQFCFCENYEIGVYGNAGYILNRMHLLKKVRNRASYTQEVLDELTLKSNRSIIAKIMMRFKQIKKEIDRKKSSNQFDRVKNIISITENEWSFHTQKGKNLIIYP